MIADISEDELYLQFALEQSVRDAAGMPVTDFPASTSSNEELDPALVFAISESLRTLQLERIMRDGESARQDVVCALIFLPFPVNIPFVT